MASLSRPTRATYVINENVTVDTTDNEDHTFSGILFPIKCKDILPVNNVVINSIQVRGGLGPITVWVSNDNNEVNENNNTTTTTATNNNNNTANNRRQNNHRYNLRNRNNNNNTTSGNLIMSEKHWTKIYEKEHKSSFRNYEPLDLSNNPIVLRPGQTRGVYIHSSIEDDTGIVYDNQQKIKTHDDKFITVLPGRAHVSTKPFGTMPIWGHGNPWRDYREFVGRLSYGVVYDLWNPTENLRFGNGFRHLALTLFACQRRIESPLCRLPDECIFYILNMCRWDWVDDTFDEVRAHKKKTRHLANDETGNTDNAATAAAGATITSASDSTGVTVQESKSESNDKQEVASVDDVKMKAIKISNNDDDNNEVDDRAKEDTEQDGEEFYVGRENDSDDEDSVDGEFVEEYDEDFVDSEDDDDDDESDDSEHPAGIFQYNIYDDYESSGEDEEREAHRLHEEREARRRWMRRLHFLQHWAGLEESGFYINVDDSDDEESS